MKINSLPIKSSLSDSNLSTPYNGPFILLRISSKHHSNQVQDFPCDFKLGLNLPITILRNMKDKCPLSNVIILGSSYNSISGTQDTFITVKTHLQSVFVCGQIKY